MNNTELIARLRDAGRYNSIHGSWATEAADALSHLTAGDVSLPPAVRLKISVADSEVLVPGEWCKAADAKDYGDRRAAAAVLAEREKTK